MQPWLALAEFVAEFAFEGEYKKDDDYTRKEEQKVDNMFRPSNFDKISATLHRLYLLALSANLGLFPEYGLPGWNCMRAERDGFFLNFVEKSQYGTVHLQ